MISLGDKVRTRNGAEAGIVVDVLRSDTMSGRFCRVLFDGEPNASRVIYDADDLVLVEDAKHYDYELRSEDGVVVAVLYEGCGDLRREVARGHGHIIHDDPLLGYTQAASYALKKIYQSLGGFSK